MAVLKHFFEQGFLRPLKSQKKSEYGFVWVISSSFGANFMVNFHNSEISGILCHQVDIFAIFCNILTIDFSGPLNNTTDPKTKKYTITQVNSKHKTFLTRDCMKGRFMTFYVTILKKNNFLNFFSQLPCGFDEFQNKFECSFC